MERSTKATTVDRKRWNTYDALGVNRNADNLHGSPVAHKRLP
jgi:hypothetical protein